MRRHAWIQHTTDRIARLTDRPAWRVGRTVATLVGRLVALNLDAVRRARTSGAAWPEWPASPWGGARVDRPLRSRRELETSLVSDRGCAAHHDHDACFAARELGERWPDSDDVVHLLEETMTRSERPPCVKQAAAETLASLGSETAVRALERMTAVAQRRAEWDGKREDSALLAAVDRRLSA
ncbi:MAG: hypothetical protein R3A78_13910 [Polyangiales bacterium]